MYIKLKPLKVKNNLRSYFFCAYFVCTYANSFISFTHAGDALT